MKWQNIKISDSAIKRSMQKSLHERLGADATLDAASLPKIRMPNRDGFVGDGRPDTSNVPCRTDCN